MRRTLLLACLIGVSSPTLALDLRIATWNLGWHLSQAEAQTWITRCGAPFARNAATGQWEPASSGTPGWELK